MPPSWLRGEALKEWKRIAPQLKGLGLFSEIDEMALCGYCETWAEWRKSGRQLARQGSVMKTKSGFLMISPWFNIRIKTERALRQYLADFGMTPASRSRVKAADPAQAEDPFAEFEKTAGARRKA